MHRHSLWTATMAVLLMAFFFLSVAIVEAQSIILLLPSSKSAKSHGIAMYGDLKYGPDFKHFDYANPRATKGGKVTRSAIGTFDNLNPYIMKGVVAAGSNILFSTLAVNSHDEPASNYCLVCETIELAEDRSWVAFTLRPEARFSDGSTVTVEDVIFSFDILKAKGHPFYRQYWHDVIRAENTGPRTVKFIFRKGAENRELPLIIGGLPVLSRAYWMKRDFEKTTLEPPVGSGPYAVESVDPGRSITYKRVNNWWADNLPVNAGRYNFDTIKYVYYRDITVSLEAFKAGEYDISWETSSKQWATGYDSPAVKKGLIRKEEIPDGSPVGMQGLMFNTRRPIFRDRRVREALGYAFDFEWTNQKLMYGAYHRTKSHFERSELAAKGLPSSEELKILEKYRGRIPDEVFTKEFQPPATDGSGDIRQNLRMAVSLLGSAGWAVDPKTRRLVHKNLRDERGNPLKMEFEILLDSPAFERLVLPFVANLDKLGISVRVRTVDDSQYVNRLRKFDFDMIIGVAGGEIAPGNEQRAFWNSKSADTEGGLNYAGVKDAVVDELVELVISAQDRQSLVMRTRAMDRVLLWGHYVIPQWHVAHTRAAYWDKFSRPELIPRYRIDFYTWWIDSQKERSLAR
ncbi:MAG: extracellular solute-binding protein [Candidatus Sungiibacteriota bacterium]